MCMPAASPRRQRVSTLRACTSISRLTVTYALLAGGHTRYVLCRHLMRAFGIIVQPGEAVTVVQP